jgi:hypothetical protein
LHYKNILADQTLLASQILCINETKIENIYANKEIHNALLKNSAFYVLKSNMA